MRWLLCLVAISVIGALAEARDLRHEIPAEVPEFGNYGKIKTSFGN